MTRFLPKSLAGQMALLLGLALLAAQIVNFALVLNERQKLSLAQNEGPAITRFAALAGEIAQAPPGEREAIAGDTSRRGARFAIVPDRAARLDGIGRDRTLEARLAGALGDAGAPAGEVRAGSGELTGRRGRPGAWRDVRALHLAARLPDGAWLVGRLAVPRRDPLLALRLAAGTLVLYLVVLGASLWIARRLTRPLGELRAAAEQFGGRGEPAEVRVTGPSDLASALAAFNAMGRRVSALLDEKDRMLGAIGHDLRTPLASLRIRVEAVEDPGERAQAIATIDEMTAILEDILMLARTGRAREAARPTDLSALVDSLVSEYEELGKPVGFDHSARVVVPVQSVLLRRALRNLIDNALAYAGSASLAVSADDGTARITVVDRGPGIPAQELAGVLEPFRRLEGSRSRDTGGSGLGLAIARAVAESHGGTLTLANRPEGGLAATIALPVALPPRLP